jgi:hypothetical protein
MGLNHDIVNADSAIASCALLLLRVNSMPREDKVYQEFLSPGIVACARNSKITVV